MRPLDAPTAATSSAAVGWSSRQEGLDCLIVPRSDMVDAAAISSVSEPTAVLMVANHASVRRV